MIAQHAWRYKGYSVMVGERPGLKAGGVWNQTCIFCHNTVPLLFTLFGALQPGAPAYQGEQVDPAFARAKTLALRDHRCERARRRARE